MFDVGFWEVSLIAIVALVVVGPERLPRLARTVGLYVGKARRVLRDVRSEIDREINRAELGEIKDLKNTVSEAKSQIDRATADVSKTLNENVMSQTSAADTAKDTDTASDSGSDTDLDSGDNTIHKKADDAKPPQPVADPPMPAALRAASMSGGAASASNAISAAAADSDATATGNDASKKNRPEQTGDLPIPPEDKSDDDY